LYFLVAQIQLELNYPLSGVFLNGKFLQLMKERSRAAQLDVCLRAVAAEVTRTTTITSDLQNSTLPLLAGMETRLKQLLKMTATDLKPKPRP
jgi:C4-dicarboxylate-specific signal transduction histidine kinase